MHDPTWRSLACTPTANFSTTSRRSSKTTPNGPIGSSATLRKSSRTETTSISKSGIRNKGGSGKDCPHESSSFPIGIGLTKTVMTRSTRSGERSLCPRVIGRLEPSPRSREERLEDQLPLGHWPKEDAGHEKGQADHFHPSSIRSWSPVSRTARQSRGVG